MTPSTPHDPQGLDLAKQIAARAAGAAPRSRQGQARPRSRKAGDLEPIGDLVAEVIENAGWSTRIGLANLLGRWKELVGVDNASHSTPEAFDDHVLTIRAESTAWATALRQLAPQLVAMLNDKLGDGTVVRVQVIGPQAPSWKKGRRSVPGRGPRDTYG